MINALNAKIMMHIKINVIGLYHRLISSDFAANVSETFATRILLIGIGLLTSVTIARILGPDGRGLYAVVIATSAIGVQFGNLGLHASNTYFVARDRALLPALIGNTLVIGFILGGLGSALLFCILSLWPSFAPVNGLLLALAMISIPFGLSYMLLQNILIGLYKVRIYNVAELIIKIFGLILIWIIIYSKWVSVETLAISGIMTVVVGISWILCILFKDLSSIPMPSFNLFKDTIRYGLKAYIAGLFGFLIIKIDLLLVNSILGAEQTGYYSIAVAIADMIYILPVIVGTILFSKLSAMLSDYEKWKCAKETAVVVGIIMIFLNSVAALIAYPVVLLLYGNAFLPAVPSFIWLMPAIFFLSINTILMNFFASRGMPAITVYSPLVSTIANVILNLKLIPLWGIVGASVASTISYGLMLIFSLIYIYFWSDIRVHPDF